MDFFFFWAFGFEKGFPGAALVSLAGLEVTGLAGDLSLREAGQKLGPGLRRPHPEGEPQPLWRIEPQASVWTCPTLTLTWSAFLLSLHSSLGVHNRSEWPGSAGMVTAG